MHIIPYGKQNVTEDDINAVISVLKSDMLTQGPNVGQFEKAFAEYVGSEFAVAVSNGTAALHLSILAMGLMEGEKVITTPITFSASANCVRYVGGEVVFSDINPKTLLMDFEKLELLLSKSPYGTYKGIIPVDFSGRAVDLEALKILAIKYGCWIIEDACHAPGGFFLDSENNVQLCGNGKYADLSIFSFHPVKHITAGEGGIITTNSRKLYERLINLRTHGIQQDKTLNVYKQGGWYYEMQELGYNYRLTDIQAALGYSQLKRADKGLVKRKNIAKIYNDAFQNEYFIINQSGLYEGHAYHLYVIEVLDRDRLFEFLRSNGIIVQVHYIPVHLMPYYRGLGWKDGDMVNSEEYYSRCISLPIYPTLTSDEQDYVISKIREFYGK